MLNHNSFFRGNSPNERRACTRPPGASRKLWPSVVVTLSRRYIQSPQQTLICVMRPAIFMLHLFAGNSSPADLTPCSQRPAAARVGTGGGCDARMKNTSRFEHRCWSGADQESGADNERLRQLVQ